MLPASHALTGYLAARFLRWRVGPEHDPSPWRPDPLIVIAVAGTLFPDWDLLPSFLLDCEWPGAVPGLAGLPSRPHALCGRRRVASPLLAAPFRYAWRWLFGSAPPMKLLTVAALLGLLSHVFWDLLNPWGVELYWPFSSRAVSGLLLHGQDLFVLAVLLLAHCWFGGEVYRRLSRRGSAAPRLSTVPAQLSREGDAGCGAAIPGGRDPSLPKSAARLSVVGGCRVGGGDRRPLPVAAVGHRNPLGPVGAARLSPSDRGDVATMGSGGLRRRANLYVRGSPTPRMTGSSWSSGGTCAKPCWRSALRSRQGFMFGSTRRERSWSTAKSGSCDRCCDLGSFPGSHP